MKHGRKSRQRTVRSARSSGQTQYTYHWCEHDMAWTIHKPVDCLLGKQHKEEQKKKPHKANSGTFAAAAETAVNPQFATLVASINNLDE
jgi:hypothetical protein